MMHSAASVLLLCTFLFVLPSSQNTTTVCCLSYPRHEVQFTAVLNPSTRLPVFCLTRNTLHTSEQHRKMSPNTFQTTQLFLSSNFWHCKQNPSKQKKKFPQNNECKRALEDKFPLALLDILGICANYINSWKLKQVHISRIKLKMEVTP